MTGYIPDEMLNRIPYPETGLEDVGIDKLVGEIVYKVPGASEIAVRKETWHTICDFCARTGALLEKKSAQDETIKVNPNHGDFMYVSGVFSGDFPIEPLAWKTRGVELDCGGMANCHALVAVRPRQDDATKDGGVWSPKIPKYIIDKYGDCILHGALMRIYAMVNEPWGNVGMARMHAVAYNNDLNRLSFGLITSGMRRHLLVNVEDFIVNMGGTAANGNG